MHSTFFRIFFLLVFSFAGAESLYAQEAGFLKSAENLNDYYQVFPTIISSAYTETSPVILNQHQGSQYLMFVSDRYKDYQKTPFGLYFVEKTNDSTFKPEVNQLKMKLKKKNISAATVSEDGFTVCFSAIMKKKNIEYSSLFYSTYNYKKDKWAKPKQLKTLSGTKSVALTPVAKPKMLPSQDQHPTLSADGMMLAFASDRDGGKGKYDIWISRRTPDGWSKPENAGESINTQENEMYPFLNGDAKMLSFSSSGRGGVGGLDIFLSFRNDEGWEIPKNAGEPLNSSGDDFSAYWMNNDSMVLFSSTRLGGVGETDIYRAVYLGEPESIVAKNLLTDEAGSVKVEGKILAKADKKELLNTKVTLFELSEEGNWVEKQKSEPDKDKYQFTLDGNKKYKIEGGAMGYVPSEVFINTGMMEMEMKNNTGKDALVRDIFVDPDVFGLYSDYYSTITQKEVLITFKINNIYYDYDKYFIRPDAAVELDKILKIMLLHPDMTIMITSHTDSKASPEYNQRLSDLRAGAAVKYLVEKGIRAERITFKGLGETKPVYFPEKNEYEMQVNRRTEFRITSLKFETQSVIPEKVKVGESKSKN